MCSGNQIVSVRTTPSALAPANTFHAVSITVKVSDTTVSSPVTVKLNVDDFLLTVSATVTGGSAVCSSQDSHTLVCTVPTGGSSFTVQASSTAAGVGVADIVAFATTSTDCAVASHAVVIGNLFADNNCGCSVGCGTFTPSTTCSGICGSCGFTNRRRSLVEMFGRTVANVPAARARAAISVMHRRGASDSPIRDRCGPLVQFVFNGQVLWSNKDQVEFEKEGEILGELQFMAEQDKSFTYEVKTSLPSDCNSMDVFVWDPKVTLTAVTSDLTMHNLEGGVIAMK